MVIEQPRLKIAIVVFLFLSIILLSNGNKAWASPEQSPDHQTVPTRVRNTPTSTTKPVTPSKTPTVKPISSTPTKIGTPIGPTAAPPTATQEQVSTDSKNQTATATLPHETPSATPTIQVEYTPTIAQSVRTPLPTMETVVVPSAVAGLPTVATATQTPASRWKNAKALEIVVIILIILSVLAYVLWKRRSPSSRRIR
jgi:hypothetical protein